MANGGGVANGGGGANGRPFVPSPYFFKTYSTQGPRGGHRQAGSPRQGYAGELLLNATLRIDKGSL